MGHLARRRYGTEETVRWARHPFLKNRLGGNLVVMKSPGRPMKP